MNNKGFYGTWYARFLKAYQGKRYSDMALSVLGLLLFHAFLGTLAVFAIQIFREWIIVIAIAICVTVYYSKSQQKKAEMQAAALDEAERAAIEVRAENTAEIIIEDVAEVVKSKASLLKLEPVTSSSDIKAKKAFNIVDKDCIAYIFEVNKAETRDYDCELVRETLQKCISQKLKDGELPNFPSAHINCNGRFYEALVLHKVRDNGIYLQLYFFVTSDGYIKRLDATEKARIEVKMGSKENYLAGR